MFADARAAGVGSADRSVEDRGLGEAQSSAGQGESGAVTSAVL